MIPLFSSLVKTLVSIVLIFASRLVTVFVPDMYGNTRGMFEQIEPSVVVSILASFFIILAEYNSQQCLIVMFQNYNSIRSELNHEEEEYKKNQNILQSSLPPSVIVRMKKQVQTKQELKTSAAVAALNNDEELIGNNDMIFDNIECGTIAFVKVEEIEKFMYENEQNMSIAINFLQELFTKFDFICAQQHCHKIKSIQNIYLFCAGIEQEEQQKASSAKNEFMVNVAKTTLQFLQCFQQLRSTYKLDSNRVSSSPSTPKLEAASHSPEPTILISEADKTAADATATIHIQVAPSMGLPSNLELKIGIASGSFCAGVLGTTKFLYDIFGDAVNVASRMTYASEPGKILICGEQLVETLKEQPQVFKVESRGELDIKGKGKIQTHWLAAC